MIGYLATATLLLIAVSNS